MAAPRRCRPRRSGSPAGARRRAARASGAAPQRVLRRIEQVNHQRRRPDLVEGELELGHHPEVPAAAAQPPEQLRVLPFAGRQQLAVRAHQLQADDVVTGQPVPPGQPAHAAAQGEAADPGVGDVAGRGGQPVGLGGPVQVAQQRAATHPGATPVRVDPDRPHRRQVQHQPAVGHRDAQDAVAAAPHPQLQPQRPAQAHRGGDVGGAGAAGDDRRAPVDHRVPHLPRGVVAVLVGQQDLPMEAAAQPCHLGAVRHLNRLSGHPAPPSGSRRHRASC
jgi:hypothetical protein